MRPSSIGEANKKLENGQSIKELDHLNNLNEGTEYEKSVSNSESNRSSPGEKEESLRKPSFSTLEPNLNST